MKRSILITFLVCFCLEPTLAASSDGTAEASNQSLKRSDNEIIWCFDQYVPYCVKDERGYGGIDFSLMSTIAARLGVKLKVAELPFSRCLAYMETGQIDVMSTLARSEDRARYVQYVEPAPYKNIGIVLYTRVNSPLTIDRYEDLYKLRVGVVNGIKYSPQFDKDLSIRREFANDVLTNLRKLELNHVDAIINTELEADFLIVDHGFDGLFKKSKLRFDNESGFVAVSKKSWLMGRLPQLSEVLSEMVNKDMVESMTSMALDQLRVRAATKYSSKSKVKP